MFRFFIFFILAFTIHSVYAADMETIVKQTLEQKESLKQNSYSHLKDFDPNANFDHYSANPAQTQYYGGSTQSDTSKLNQDAMAGKSSITEGKYITSSIRQHPNFVISQSDPDISHSQFIQNNAESIVRGITDRYVDCKAGETCKMVFEQKTCEEEPQAIAQLCTKTLNIDVISHETTTHYTLVAHIKTSDHKYAGIAINAVTGKVGFIGPHDTSFSMDSYLPASLDCNGLQGSVTRIDDHSRATSIDTITFPNCQNGLGLAIHLTGKNTINTDITIDIASKSISYDTSDRWVENCDGLLQEPSCQFVSKECSGPKETKTFQGISVAKDCWQETYHYMCHSGHGKGNCNTLKVQECEQIDSVCKDKNDQACVLYQQTYQCPIKTCTPSSNIACGDGANYCLDGNCVDHHYEESKAFSKGVSALSAVADASKQLNPDLLKIFSGYPLKCSEIPVGFSNCCTETGWGQDLGLANCSADAKKLHEARTNKLAVKVGRYCSGPDPFPCLEHSQVYCVFNSKLAKIIQEQGRLGQLHMDLGSAQSPRCEGVTPEQLKSIDLSQIDFQDFYADIHAKAPDINQIQQKISEQVQQFQKAGQVSG